MSSPATTSVTVASSPVRASRRAATGAALGGGGDGPCLGDEAFDVRVVGGEGVLAGQEGDRALPEGGEVRRGLGGQRVDAVVVGVPQVLQRQQVALGVAQFGQSGDPGGGLAGLLAAQPAHHRGDPPGAFVEGLGGAAGEVAYGLELGQHLLGGGVQVRQRGAQVAEFLLAQPVVGVQGAGAVGGQGAVPLGRRVGLGGGAGQGQAVGDAAHQVGVADPGEAALAGRPGRGVGVGDVGRVPQLERVDAGGVVAVGAQQGEPSVVEQGPAVAGQRGGDGLPDLVVRQQQSASAGGCVEGVEHVLAMR
ncbi:hypothetical protein RKD26_001357 [Streptomyces calvus]